MSIAESWLAEFDREMAQTRRVLERVPEDKMEWRPHAKSMTLGRLALHVAEIPGLAGAVAALPGLDISKTDFNRAAKSRQELFEAFDKASAQAREAVAALKDESLLDTWEMTLNGRTVLSMPRAGAYRTLAMNHLIHHRGQLSVYLRLLDVPVPGLYGPSADEQ
jgi:uncharacterized damage-inducible protein DinB